MSNKLDTNPSDFKCPSCSVQMPKRMSMTGRSDGSMRKGMVIVCSACAGVSMLGDNALHPMTAKEFASLTPETKRALVITKTEIEATLKAGGKWSPYAKS